MNAMENANPASDADILVGEDKLWTNIYYVWYNYIIDKLYIMSSGDVQGRGD